MPSPSSQSSPMFASVCFLFVNFISIFYNPSYGDLAFYSKNRLPLPPATHTHPGLRNLQVDLTYCLIVGAISS